MTPASEATNGGLLDARVAHVDPASLTTPPGGVTPERLDVARARLSSVRTLQALLVLGLGTLTLALVADPRLSFAIRAPSLYLVLETVGALVALAVAALGYVRYRETGDATALFDGAAFLVAAAIFGLRVVLVALGLDGTVGLGTSNPHVLPLFLGALGRDVAIAILLLGAVSRLRRAVLSVVGGRALMIVPSAALLAACGVLALGGDALDPMSNPGALATLAHPAADGPVLLGPPVDALNLVGAVMLFVVAYLRPAQSGGALPPAWLALAFTIGAFGQLHAFLYPSSFAGIVGTATVLQLAFFLTLYVGLQVSRAEDIRALRLTDKRRRRFHHADVASAAQEERLRLARELHDTIVQQLLATRQEQSRAAELVPADAGRARAAAQRVASMLSDAVAEGRGLIDSLRGAETGERRLTEELGPRLRVFAERYGYTLEFRSDPALAVVAGARATEVLRIVDEALANIRRHADATNVRVTAARVGDQLILAIADNGRGFAREHTPPGHGMAGMLERTALLGGRLTIHSAPGEGTQLRLFAPLQADDAG